MELKLYHALDKMNIERVVSDNIQFVYESEYLYLLSFDLFQCKIKLKYYFVRFIESIFKTFDDSICYKKYAAAKTASNLLNRISNFQV